MRSRLADPRIWATLLCSLLLGTAHAQQQTGGRVGKVLYERHCAVCHGLTGGADTPVARLLSLPPRHFNDPVAMARLNDSQMYLAIRDGRPGTAMASWRGVLSEMEIVNLVDYIRGLTPSTDLSREEISLAVGRRIYERECAPCHGMKGRPDTEVAKVLDPPPRNLADPLAMARVDDGRMYAAIKLGRAGTAMGSWNVLLDAVEIIDVIRYVRTLEQPLPIGMKKEDVDAEVGGQIYRRYCVSCHGAQGKANTPLARTLKPTPRDLTTRAMRARTELSMRHAIAAGIPGSAMAPWRGILSLQDIQRVVRYIRRTLQRPPA